MLLLLSGSLTTQAQNRFPMVQFSCPETTSFPKSTLESRPAVSGKTVTASQPHPAAGQERTQGTCSGVINVNIHFMLRLDGTGNFNETNDGAPYKPWNALPTAPLIQADTAKNGYARARALVQEMNNQAASSPMNSNPAGTSNPAKGFSYALNGVYFHRVTQAEYDITKNDYSGYTSTAPFDNYGVHKPGR